jgi:hypothetical protein
MTVNRFGITLTVLAVFYCGNVSLGQSNLDEVRRKITPSHEIWSEYEMVKIGRETNVPQKPAPQPSNNQRKPGNITPAHEIWLEYEKLKFDMSPAGEKAVIEKVAEQERQIAEAKTIAEEAIQDFRKAVQALTRTEVEADRSEWRVIRFATFKPMREAERTIQVFKESGAGTAEYGQMETAVAGLKQDIKNSEERAKAIEDQVRKETADKIAAEQSATEAKAAGEKAAELEQQRQMQYDKLVQEKNRATTENQFSMLAQQFRAMEGYKDTAALASQCDAQYQRLKAERERHEELARPVDLKEEIRKSGWDNIDNLFTVYLSYFADSGNAILKKNWHEETGNLNRADAFNKANVQKRIDALEAEIWAARRAIAQKTFFCEYTYSIWDVTVVGNQSTCTVYIDIGFTNRMRNQIAWSFVEPNVAVTGVKTSIGGSGFQFTIRGNTDNVEKLVNNAKDYRAKIQLQNLRSKTEKIGYMGVEADIRSIEIIKVR